MIHIWLLNKLIISSGSRNIKPLSVLGLTIEQFSPDRGRMGIWWSHNWRGRGVPLPSTATTYQMRLWNTWERIFLIKPFEYMDTYAHSSLVDKLSFTITDGSDSVTPKNRQCTNLAW